MSDKIKFLIIDDEPDIIEIIEDEMAQSLGPGSYEVFKARDGREGLEIIEFAGPDIIITDIKMPKMDGLDLIKKAREIKNNSLFIVSTGFGNKFEVVQFLKYGAFDYIEKPIRPGQLAPILHRAAHYLSFKNSLFDQIQLILKDGNLTADQCSQVFDFFNSVDLERYHFEVENLNENMDAKEAPRKRP